MSAAINAVAFAGWDVSVKSAAHHGWLLSDAVVTPPVQPIDGDVFAFEDDLRRRREEEELIPLIIALHESRR